MMRSSLMLISGQTVEAVLLKEVIQRLLHEILYRPVGLHGQNADLLKCLLAHIEGDRPLPYA